MEKFSVMKNNSEFIFLCGKTPAEWTATPTQSHLSLCPQLQLRFVLDEEHRAESAHGLVKYHRVTLEVPRKTK